MTDQTNPSSPTHNRACGRAQSWATVLSSLRSYSRATSRNDRTIDGQRTRILASDFPCANDFPIHLLAAVAEYDPEPIPKRIEAIMAAIKAARDDMKTKGDSDHQFPPAVDGRTARTRRASGSTKIQSGSAHFEVNHKGGSLMASWLMVQRADVVRFGGVPVEPRCCSRICKSDGRRLEVVAEVVGCQHVRVTHNSEFDSTSTELGPLLLTWRGEGWWYSVIASETAPTQHHSPGGRIDRFDRRLLKRRSASRAAAPQTGEAAKSSAPVIVSTGYRRPRRRSIWPSRAATSARVTSPRTPDPSSQS